MTAILTPEEVEARLRLIAETRPFPKATLEGKAADVIADLRRERDELRKIHDEITHALESAGYAHMSNGEGIAHICSELEAAERALAEARAAIAWANNSLFGSHGFFLSTTGGPTDEHHLDTAIENLKKYSRQEWRRAEEASAEERYARAEATERHMAVRAECDRQRERAEKWQAAAEGERERIICDCRVEAVLPDYESLKGYRTEMKPLPGYWVAAIRAIPPPTIEPSVTDTEKSNA